jgi:hypothetical protein
MPRGMSILNVAEEYNNLLKEYKTLEEENKTLKEKLYKPENIVKNFVTKNDNSIWNRGFVIGVVSVFIGTYCGMIFHISNYNI